LPKHGAEQTNHTWKALIGDQKVMVQRLESQQREDEASYKKGLSSYAKSLARPIALAMILIALVVTGSIWFNLASNLANGLAIAKSAINKATGVSKNDEIIQSNKQMPYGSISIPPLEISEIYDQAMEDYEARRHDSAMEKLQRILERPTYHELKDNAQYWLAECYFSKGEYDRALTEFGKVKKNFPTGNKVFDSQVMIAYTYCKLGRIKQARYRLYRLSVDFPDAEHQLSILDLSKKICSVENRG
jgi:TolA-binding protein